MAVRIQATADAACLSAAKARALSLEPGGR